MKLFCALFFVATTVLAVEKTSFKNSYLRYVSTHDLIRLLMQKFPDAEFKQDSICDSLKDENRAVLGEPNPSTGEAVYTGPSPAFLKLYGNCLLKLIDADIANAAKKPQGYHRFFGKTAIALFEKNGQIKIAEEPSQFKWTSLSPELQLAITTHLVHQMIGPSIVKNEAKFVGDLMASLPVKTEPTVSSALKKLLFFVATQDEFLSY